MSHTMLKAFERTRITYPPRSISHYYPSSHMMDYILHCMNSALAGDYRFKNAAPDYHPYILRLYFGVLFWVQSLRAEHDVAALNSDNHNFLRHFLSYHPLSTLPIPGPLLPLFQTLCASQPEFSNYAKVYPRLPRHPGPAARSEFIRDSVKCHMLPNVPGIFALLEDLNLLASDTRAPVYPKLGRHIPVTETSSTVFGHHRFPINSERSELEKWALVSSGLQYPCEADQKLNEAFAVCYESFDFPITKGDDNLEKISSFLGMDKSMSWFSLVKQVALTAASFFEGSGTLADCAASGLAANQVIVVMRPPPADVAPRAPTCSADKRSLFGFSFHLKSTARNLPPLTEACAAFAQTHIRMYGSHPYYGQFGRKSLSNGPFWAIRPIESSPVDDFSYVSIVSMVRRMMKS